MKQKKINITCTKKQAQLIEVALDTLSRMVCGQLHQMITGMDNMRGKCFEYNQESEGHIETFMGYKLGDFIEKFVKPKIFPELAENESYGVGLKNIGDAQVAYEMVKKLQNFRTKDFPGDEGGVLRHEPIHCSKEPLIVITDSNKKGK